MKLLSSVAAFLLLAGLAGAQAPLPQCTVTAKLTITRKPVVAGHLMTIKVGVKNTGAMPITALNVELNLPDNCCVAKGGVLPSLKKTSSPNANGQPTVSDQNVFWLNTPLAPKKGRTFSLKVRVSSLYTSATTLPVTALVYASNTTGAATCSTPLANTLNVAPPKTKRDLELDAEERELLGGTNPAVTCPRPTGTGDYWLYQANQAPLHPIASSLTSGATAETCYVACSLEFSLAVPFYFAVNAAGACVCSQEGTVIYQQGTTNYQVDVAATAAPTAAPSSAPTGTPTAAPTPAPTV